MMSTEHTPFTLNVSDDQIADLKARLSQARMPADLAFEDGRRGVQIDRVQPLIDAWMNDFDWRAVEQFWNTYPQFIADIDGQPFHYFHIRSKHEDATPLLLLHGFPGSFIEFTRVIEPLTNPDSADDAFHLVIPSLAGFGYSTPMRDAGWGSKRNAAALAELMSQLGYERFGAQGGDYGAMVAPDLGRVCPDRMIGVHVNAASVGFIPFHEVEGDELASLTDFEQTNIEHLQWYMQDGNWYYDIQAKRPQALSYGLSDSPAGLLAYIQNLFLDFSANLKPFTDDPDNRDLFLANVSLYWFTNCFATAATPYYEDMHVEDYPEPQNAPTGVVAFAHDASIRRYSEDANTNIVHWSNIDEGGHFAALEVPDLLVKDVQEFFRTVR